MLEEIEMLLFPHEKGVVGSQPVKDQLHIRRILFFQQVGDKGAKVRVPFLAEQRGQAAGNKLALLAQIYAIMAMDKFDELSEIVIRNVA